MAPVDVDLSNTHSLAPLGEAKGTATAPRLGAVSKIRSADEIAKLAHDNPGLSLNELRTLANRLFSTSEVSV